MESPNYIKAKELWNSFLKCGTSSKDGQEKGWRKGSLGHSCQ